jgi:hypothetical protein
MNLVYNSGANMDQEASWVGLGWNITPGQINRNMRGLPDEFNGDDVVEKEYNVRDNNTYGGSVNGVLELFGCDALKLNLSRGLSYNTYTKFAVETSINPSFRFGPLNASIGVTSNSQTGVDIKPSVGISFEKEKNLETYSQTGTIGLTAGLSYNSRAGLKSMSIESTYRQSSEVVEERKHGKVTGEQAIGAGDISSGIGGSSYTFATSTYTPQINMPMSNFGLTLSGTLGADAWGLHPAGGLTGYMSTQYLANNSQALPAYGYMNLEKNYVKSNGKVLLDFNREKDGTYFGNVPNLPLASMTYDVYSITGQGVSGSYRPSRSDVGYVFDNTMSNDPGPNISAGVEIGAGGIAHTGFNAQVSSTKSTSGRWSSGNVFSSVLRFKAKNDVLSSDKNLYEPFYFRQIG